MRGFFVLERLFVCLKYRLGLSRWVGCEVKGELMRLVVGFNEGWWEA